MLGISEEQHGDRTRLFMQWRQMEWPVLIDSLNLLEVKAVPITLLIDESGVIRYSNPKEAELQAFLAASYPTATAPAPFVLDAKLSRAVYAVHSGSAKAITEAIEAYTAIREKSPRQWFHSGVLHRKRYDSDGSQSLDFAGAVDAWSKALAGDPSQYIWRRRIQQYGPRLDKPYPFYDWVPKAREAISARGEHPVELVAEPSGAEFAAPSRGQDPKTATTPHVHPDPANKLPDDPNGLVSVSAVAVPSTDSKRPGYRVHLTFAINNKRDAHWNNESGDMVVWLDKTGSWAPPAAAQASTVAISNTAASSATSSETRRHEFELQPGGAERAPLPNTLSGNAFFYICEGTNGTCQYLRKSFNVTLQSEANRSR